MGETKRVELPIRFSQPVFRQRQNSYARLRCRWSSGKKRRRDLTETQEKIEEHLQSNKVTLEESINLYENWPTHPMMDVLISQTKTFLKKFLLNKSRRCDKKDLLFQVLFRLTTYSPNQIFEESEKISSLLDGISTDKWRSILSLDKKQFQKLTLNTSILARITEEQFAIIEKRMEESSLPLKDILSKKDICTGKWKLKRHNQEIIATNDTNGIEKKVEFREVRSSLAEIFHRDLHYIHAPRAGRSFGLFEKGKKFPFAIESIKPIERDYKKAGLILRGHDPSKCIELTRLYNRPGAPLNTVSVFDKELFTYFKQKKSVEAVITTIMPTYTLSKSQITGGIDKPYLIKKPSHKFIPHYNGEKTFYEHATRRKIEQKNADIAKTNNKKFPLLPVMELINSLQKPSIQPSNTITNNMLSIGYDQ